MFTIVLVAAKKYKTFLEPLNSLIDESRGGFNRIEAEL